MLMWTETRSSFRDKHIIVCSCSSRPKLLVLLVLDLSMNASWACCVSTSSDLCQISLITLLPCVRCEIYLPRRVLKLLVTVRKVKSEPQTLSLRDLTCNGSLNSPFVSSPLLKKLLSLLKVSLLLTLLSSAALLSIKML